MGQCVPWAPYHQIQVISQIQRCDVMKYSQIKAYQAKHSLLDDLNDERMHQLTSTEHYTCVVEEEV